LGDRSRLGYHIADREGWVLGDATQNAVMACRMHLAAKMKHSGRPKSRKEGNQDLEKTDIFTRLAHGRPRNYEVSGNCETQVLEISFLKFIFSS
jgi:hypothetical protein